MAGIYISWPFCAQKCTYCNFASGVQPKDLEKRYLEALIAEIKSTVPAHPDTLYLGGGTPSSMDAESIAQLSAALPTAWSEATLEASPGTLTPDLIKAWKSAGINRVSLGVQSFIKHELTRTGRRHDAATVSADVAMLLDAGVSNVNIDLIAGLPGQTTESWQQSLDALIKLGAPHASVYMLEVDDDSRLGAEILLNGKRYGAPDVPTDDQIAAFYENAVDYLARHGIHRYEISNFARHGAESAHNLKYWRRGDYYAFGADAHSFDGATRWQNVETAAEYVQRFEKGDSPRLTSTAANAAEEKFFVGLRLTEGIRPEPADWLRFGPALTRYLSDGLLESSDGRIRLTNRGVMISNEIFQEFIAA